MLSNFETRVGAFGPSHFETFLARKRFYDELGLVAGDALPFQLIDPDEITLIEIRPPAAHDAAVRATVPEAFLEALQPVMARAMAPVSARINLS